MRHPTPAEVPAKTKKFSQIAIQKNVSTKRFKSCSNPAIQKMFLLKISNLAVNPAMQKCLGT